MRKKALVLTTMLIVIFVWSCKKEENPEPSVAPDSSQLKATQMLIYADSVYSSAVSVYQPTNYMRGESFITPSSAPQMKISSVKVRLSKAGNPTGYAKILLYKTTGIWGFGIQKPTGNPIAKSDSINVATALTTTASTKIFTFTGVNQYLMNVNTSYFVVFCYKSGNSTNYVKLAMDDMGNTDGNHVRWGLYGGVYQWLVETSRNMYFFVYAQ